LREILQGSRTPARGSRVFRRQQTTMLRFLQPWAGWPSPGRRPDSRSGPAGTV